MFFMNLFKIKKKHITIFDIIFDIITLEKLDIKYFINTCIFLWFLSLIPSEKTPKLGKLDFRHCKFRHSLKNYFD